LFENPENVLVVHPSKNLIFKALAKTMDNNFKIFQDLIKGYYSNHYKDSLDHTTLAYFKFTSELEHSSMHIKAVPQCYNSKLVYSWQLKYSICNSICLGNWWRTFCSFNKSQLSLLFGFVHFKLLNVQFEQKVFPMSQISFFAQVIQIIWSPTFFYPDFK